MIHTVIYGSPIEWMFQDKQPEFPIAAYDIGKGSLNIGRESVFNISLWFLDKSGREAEFETEVMSDQHSILNDIISELRNRQTKYLISENVAWDGIKEKMEDYLSGVSATFDLTVVSDFGACDFPV